MNTLTSETVETKLCTRCGPERGPLPITEFYIKKRRPGQKSGYLAVCKICFKAIYKERNYEANRGPRGLPKNNTDVVDPATTFKTCTNCGESKPLIQFHPCCENPIKKWHWHSRCIPCQSSASLNKRSLGYNRPSEKLLEYRLMLAKSKSVKNGKYQAHGQMKKLPFSLTITIIRDLIAKQSISGILRCAATGVELIDIKGHPLYPSLDRIDPEKGYEPDNVRITSRLFNIARNRWSDVETITAIKQIANAVGQPQ